MRTFTALCLISIMPLSLALASDSDYHQVHYGDAAQPPQGTMNYWDDGGYARNLLMGSNLMNNESNSQAGGTMIHQGRLDYSPAPTTPSESILLHSRPAAPSNRDDSQNSTQP